MLRFALLLAALPFLTGPAHSAAGPPNIIFILADDLGYGDVKALNPDKGKIATPSLDRLAGQGMIFTDAHSGSSVCTPTRYGVMTGRYSWRTSLASGVLGGASPPLIAEDRLTVASLLKAKGYHTHAIGKWHLGLEWVKLDQPAKRKAEGGWEVDYSQPFRRGPVSLGFDQFYGISASLDMPPFTWLEKDRVLALPTATKKWVRSGPAAPDFEAVDVLPALTKRAVETIAARAADAKSGQPFFLYLPLPSPHTPILPSPAWQGKSGLNAYADFVMQTDACVGELLSALDQQGLTENTLVIFTSDNGCSPEAGLEELASKGHDPGAGRRGMKSDIWEAGHRVPFLVRWPAKVKAGTRSPALVCLTDFMATAAAITGTALPDKAGEDSFSFLPALEGRPDQGRSSIVHHSIHGQFAIREGRWKLAFCPGSGGWSHPTDREAREGGKPARQLYDLEADPAETTNLEAAQPETVTRLTAVMEDIIARGRSTPGANQSNDKPVDYRIVRPKAGR
jgi:arylsulfatase A